MSGIPPGCPLILHGIFVSLLAQHVKEETVSFMSSINSVVVVIIILKKNKGLNQLLKGEVSPNKHAGLVSVLEEFDIVTWSLYLSKLMVFLLFFLKQKHVSSVSVNQVITTCAD